MSEENKDLEVSQEESAFDTEAQKEVKEDELRSELADKYGLDPDEESDLLDKLVEDRKTERKTLYKAIEQKKRWREQVKSTSEKSKEKSEKGDSQKGQETPSVSELIAAGIKEELEKRDISSLGVPDEIKEEIKKIARVQGISIQEAAKDPYIQFKQKELEDKERIDSATPARGSSRAGSVSIDPSKPLDSSTDKFDFSTKEGREAWEKAKAARRQKVTSQ